jgi:hypothetical protein
VNAQYCATAVAPRQEVPAHPQHGLREELWAEAAHHLKWTVAWAAGPVAARIPGFPMMARRAVQLRAQAAPQQHSAPRMQVEPNQQAARIWQLESEIRQQLAVLQSLPEQAAGRRKRAAGLRKQAAGLRKQAAGLRKQAAGLRKQAAVALSRRAQVQEAASAPQVVLSRREVQAPLEIPERHQDQELLLDVRMCEPRRDPEVLHIHPWTARCITSMGAGRPDQRSHATAP